MRPRTPRACALPAVAGCCCSAFHPSCPAGLPWCPSLPSRCAPYFPLFCQLLVPLSITWRKCGAGARSHPIPREVWNQHPNEKQQNNSLEEPFSSCGLGAAGCPPAKGSTRKLEGSSVCYQHSGLQGRRSSLLQGLWRGEQPLFLGLKSRCEQQNAWMVGNKAAAPS